MNEIKLVTDWPVAIDSPDHTHPWGVYRDNTVNTPYLNELVQSSYKVDTGRSSWVPLSGSTVSLLDLGCAGGGMIFYAVEKLGMEAIGLEGSDYWAKKALIPPFSRDLDQIKQWRKLLNKNLFTCDISRPFTLYKNNKLLQFDFITAWEVIEHIHPDRLCFLFDNIKQHLKSSGMFIGSISTNEDASSGVELHQSIKTIDDWIVLLNDHFIVEHYPFRHFARVDAGSFYIKLRNKQ